MNTAETRRRHTRRALALVTVVAAIGGLALAVQPTRAREDAEAHALVADAEHALAKGDRGAATLALERARLLAPRAGFVRTAIDAAQIHEAETPASRGVRLVTSEEWSWLATALGWLAGLSLALAVVRGRSIVSRQRIALGAAFLVAMAGVLRSSETSRAVVMSDGTARIAPYADAAVVGPLPAGAVVDRRSDHGSFVSVRSGDGVEGWIAESRLEPIAGRDR
jgi:hypothetical protein